MLDICVSWPFKIQNSRFQNSNFSAARWKVNLEVLITHLTRINPVLAGDSENPSKNLGKHLGKYLVKPGNKPGKELGISSPRDSET